MRIIIPRNTVAHDYHGVLDSFISILKEKQSTNIKSIFLCGSYARGDVTNSSDLDVFCIFHSLNETVLHDVGFAARNTPIAYENLEINAQCLSMNEINTTAFKGWTEKSARILDSVLLFGDDVFGTSVSVVELQEIYIKYLADILMSIRHYISVDEPVEKLTYKKIKTYILKPLMFPVRMERYCTCGYFPLSIGDLKLSLDDDEKFIVNYFCDEEIFNVDIASNHKKVLNRLHDFVVKGLNKYY